MRGLFRGGFSVVICCVFLSGCDGSSTGAAPQPAPDLTGMWTGTFSNPADGWTRVWPTQLDLTEFTGNADGYLVGELTIAYQGAFLRVGITGDVSTARVALRDNGVRARKDPFAGWYWCEDREMDLEYRKVNGKDQLSGRWSSATVGCVGGDVMLQRQ